MCLIFEFARGGDVFDYIVNNPFSESITRTFLHQIIEALDYLHSNKLAHRDMKVDNLLFDEDFNIKIAGFGFSKYCEDILYSSLGTIGYMAPEISLKKGYSGPAVDVFAVGVVLFAMLTGKMPFIKAYSADPLYKEIICNKPEAFWLKHKQLKEFFNEDSKDLIQKTLCFNPENRITIKQITQHPWYKGDILPMIVIKKEFFLRREIVELPPIITPKNPSNPYNILYKGIDHFRNINYEGDFADVEEVFKEELKEKRVIREEKGFSLKDFISFGDIDLILRVLLQNLLISKRKGEIIDIKLRKQEYKINAILRSEEDNIEFTVRIAGLEENKGTSVSFIRKNGDIFRFYEMVQLLRTSLQTDLKTKKK